jgi:predicted TIM-barrel fold metal-dependent hydrolase
MGTARDYVKFFLLMLAKETTQLARLTGGYRPEQNVDTLIHHMMDMQKAYANERPYYRFYKKQIKRMEALVRSSERCLLGFVAFDPRRTDPDGLEVVRYGLGRGNCGVKVYPPMGYTAYPTDPVLRERFDRLYAYCCRESIPVLTHCTAKGFEAYHFSGVLSDPDGWAEVLDQDRYRELTLCYGHAGGGGTLKKVDGPVDEVLYPGWYAENDEQWLDDKNFARKVLAHCRRYANVYCDFSYFFDLMDDSDKRTRFVNRLVQAYQGSNEPFSFRHKAMYGSDWHMPRVARHAGDFLDAMIAIFDHPVLVDHKHDFFANNALRFLDIDRCRSRHEVLQPGRGTSVC